MVFATLPDLIRCITGPRLYMIYGYNQDPKYKANALEYFSETILYFELLPVNNFKFLCTCLSVYVLFRGGNTALVSGWTQDRLKSLTTNLSAYVVIMGLTYLCRGIGRFINADYRTFLTSLRTASSYPPDDALSRLRKYDFSFDKWPISFRWKDSESGNFREPPELTSLGLESPSTPFKPIPPGSGVVHRTKTSLYQSASYYLSTTILRRLIYPGSVSLFTAPVVQQLHQMRADLVRQFNGRRYKLEAKDGNQIDTMFIDQRRMKTTNSQYLFVCCEGNFGFYEIGIMTAALQAGYTCLGWNHPGFMGSTGEPFPDQEINAINVVMRFANQKLGFSMDKIVLYGWSIGGFPAAYAAVAYPGIRGLVLDASFDHVDKLAIPRTPPPLRNIVQYSIRKYFDLDVAKLLSQYHGPVLLIRRSFEEVTSMNPDNSRPTNRANGLLRSILLSRYPGLLNSDDREERESMNLLLDEWFAREKEQQAQLMNEYGPSESRCLDVLNSSISATVNMSDNAVFPINFENSLVGMEERQQLLLFLISQHWGEFGSTHCAPLPPSYLKLPFDLQSELKSRSRL